MTQAKAIAIPAPTMADWFVPPLVVPVFLCIVIVWLGMMTP